MDLSKKLSKKKSQLERLSLRARKGLDSGAFWRISTGRRNYLVKRIKNLARSVNQLSWQLKFATIGTTLVTLGANVEAIAQSNIGPFTKKNRAANPLREYLPESELKPTVIDLDNDGDYDIVVGEDYGYLRIYKNEGTPSNPAFTEYYALDPTGTPIYDYGGAPAFADLNADGNLDLIFGVHEGSTDRIRYFTGNGGIPGDVGNPLLFTEQTGPWDGVAKTGNPFYGVYPGDKPTLSFVNFDGDGDLDVLIGHDYSNVGDGIQLHYYENDGASNFAAPVPFSTSPSIVGSSNYRLAPQLVDLDKDGNLDLIVGNEYGEFRFFKGDGINYTEQTGAWDPILKTGNPFDQISVDKQTAPAFVDLDADGDLDLIFGYYDYKYSNVELAFFENLGNEVFESREGLANPFGGTEIDGKAIPYFVDIDNDGDMDALLGGKYGSTLILYVNNANAFEKINDAENPFIDIVIDPYDGSKPAVVDIDDDGDLDFVSGGFYSYNGTHIKFYKNNGGTVNFGGVLELQPVDSSNPFYGIALSGNAAIDLVDIDNDGDFDLFAGNDSGTIDFYRNTGTKQVPFFDPLTPVADNPFDAMYIPAFASNLFVSSDTNPRFIDIDHDGDFDLLMGSYYNNGTISGDGIFFFENTGTPAMPNFVMQPGFLLTTNDNNPFPNAIDMDSDGDLDLFIGVDGGVLEYYTNDNPAPIVTVNSSTLVYIFGSGPAVIDASITIADSDNDLITQAVFVIQGYQNGDVLSFTPQGGVSGSFDTGTGTLTLSGLAPISTYQDVLRSVTYDYTGPQPTSTLKGGNSGRTVVVNKSIDVSVFDNDLTIPVIPSLAIALTVPNILPVVASSPGASTFVLAPIIIDPAISVSDNDDANLTGAMIQLAPSTFVSGEDNLLFTNQNGISGSYNSSSGILTLTGTASVGNYQTALQSVQYQNTSGSPTGSSRTIEFSVDDGEGFSPVTSKALNISPNLPPVITPSPINVAFNGILNLDLATITSDPNGNLDPTTFAIVQQPQSGVPATISGSTLTIDYSGSNFGGSDNIIFEVYDLVGERAEATLSITVTNQAPVIATSSLNTVIGNSITLDLATIISDPDNNLDPLSYSVIPNVLPTPARVGNASISNSILTIDYSVNNFAGTDYVTIEACDLGGLCTTAEISILVAGEVIVRNGLSPNGDGKNDYFKLENITSLGPENTVSIFNRWGDKVFEIDNYDNQTRKFEGKSSGGKELPTGVYFYRITFKNGIPELKGYVTLKR